MKNSKHILLAVVLQLTILSGSVQAGIVKPTAIVENGQLTGINGIEISGENWNVRFIEASPNSIELAFTDQASATNAALSLFDVFQSPDFQQYDLNPNDVFGINNKVISFIETPYKLIIPGFYSTIAFENRGETSPSGDRVSPQSISDIDTRALPDHVLADWTNVSNVPVPAAVWFMGTGLGCRNRTLKL